ncbi:MAG: hypothetical protein WAQ56_08030 [Candidatus Nitrotoga sp.]|jgi:hypothetical protein
MFGNLRGNKRLHRFTLRGKAKVDVDSGNCIAWIDWPDQAVFQGKYYRKADSRK